jgi:gamma-glutamyltranspeptidase / glutathione hydrolase
VPGSGPRALCYKCHGVAAGLPGEAASPADAACDGLVRLMKAALFAIALVMTVPPAGAASTVPAPSPAAAAVATAHPLATRAVLEVLAAGGNAFDGAIAATAALAVVEPYGSGLGGGGFWLLQRSGEGRAVMLDGRETAPRRAHRDLYLGADGRVVPGLSVNGALAAGIPGTPAALAHLALHYGRLPLERSLAPAIRYAREGFDVSVHYHAMATFRLAALRDSETAAEIFLVAGEAPEPGHRLRQPDLARTLEALARAGHDGFYRGPVAAALLAGVQQAGGIWSAEDLLAYRVVEREPVVGRYGDLKITSAAPPSSGGIALLTALGILSHLALDTSPSVSRVHLLAEAMRLAYRDRAVYLGDPDHAPVPVSRLLDADRAKALRESIRPDQATPSSSLPGKTLSGASESTSHFSILDREGNRVAATLSINYPFGAACVPPGTGVLLNNEMDDFSASPGVPNLYGLVGGEANAIAPGKRPLSSMSPTFIDGPESTFLLGTPGGSRIISMVLLAILELAEGSTLAEAVAAPRFHHQYLPDEIQHEPGTFSAAERVALGELGHATRALERVYGNMQAVGWNRVTGIVEAVSDPRGEGEALTH